jgi:hypothetical protein
MKYAVVALFIGAISAEEYLEEVEDMLKISISPAGQKAIEKEAKDVDVVAHKIAHSKPVRNLEASLKRWFHTKEMMNLHKLDQAFWKSAEGKKLIAEWRDVGELLKKHLKKQKDGSLHMSNKHIDNLSDELDDVADEYEALGHNKGGWKKKFDAAWKKSFATKEFGSVKRRAVAFKHSNEGKMLHKEVHELKVSIKKNLKITDLPDSDSDSDDEELEELLKITISHQGQNEIKKEAHDVKMTIKKIHNSPPAKALKQAFMKWAHSKEVQHLKALDKAFLKSPEGKRLMKEWHDFGMALKKNIKKDKHGIYIPNKAMDKIEDELDDVKDQYKKLEGGKWDKAYTAGWKAAIHSNEAKALHKAKMGFKNSNEGKMLKKEVVELKNKIKQHLKISDLKDSDDSSSDSEEELVAKKKVVAKKVAKKDDSSSDEEEEDLAAAKKKVIKKKVIKKKVVKKAKKDDSSSSDEEEEDLAAAKKKVVKAKKVKKVKKAKKDDSSSDEEEEDLAAAKKKVVKAKKVKKAKKDDSSSSDEEDLEEIEELLKITISKQGRKEIEKEWNDVENVWDKIDDSKPVRNVEASFKRWAHTPEMKQLEALDKKFLATPQGKKMEREAKDVFEALDDAIYHNKKGDLHIDNDDLEDVDDEVKDFIDELKKFKKSHWAKDYDHAMKKVFSNKQAQSLHRRMVAFKNSNEGKALGKEMKDFKMSLKKNVKITDLPKNFEEEDMYLY